MSLGRTPPGPFPGLSDEARQASGNVWRRWWPLCNFRWRSEVRRFVATAAELRLASPRGVESEFFEEFAAECDIQVLAGLDVAAEHEGSGADFDAGEGRWGGRGGSIVAGQPAPGGNRERFPPSGAGRPTRSDQAAVVRPGCPVGTVVAAKRQSPGNGSPWLGTWGSGGRFGLLRIVRHGSASARRRRPGRRLRCGRARSPQCAPGQGMNARNTSASWSTPTATMATRSGAVMSGPIRACGGRWPGDRASSRQFARP